MPLLRSWINTDLYEPTEENFGILPLPTSMMDKFNIRPYSRSSLPTPPLTNNSSNPSSSRLQPNIVVKKKKTSILRHSYLASRQGSKFAVLNVSSDEERALFDSLSIDPLILSAKPASSKWDQMARKWNEQANGTEIFYKVSFLTT
jgi:hypothetical protein